MKVGYISRLLPALSETFVTTEMKALEKRGLSIVPFSVHKPEEGSFQENARPVFERVNTVNKPWNPLFWLSHVMMMFSRPGGYFGALSRYVFSPDVPAKERLRLLKQFMLAPYLARLLRKEGIEHIHAHFAHIAAAVAMMAAHIAGISFSFTVHAYGLFADNLLLAEKVRDAAFIASVSRYNINYLAEHYPESTGKDVPLVRCGIDARVFTPSERTPAEYPLIVSVGRLVPMKGFASLINACSLISDRIPGLRCEIAGDGPLREQLQHQIDDNGLSDVVILRGKLMQEDIRDMLNAAWVFALPSCIRESSDNLPVVLMESLAMEIPTISTRVRAIPELIINEKTGLLVDPDDTGQLADALERMISDRSMAARLAGQGRRHLLENFSADRSAATLHERFEKAVKAGQR